jgi:hypothetical protein
MDNMFNLTGSTESVQNVNPALNMTVAPSGNVQVINVLDMPQAPNTLEQFAAADFGLLEGIPGGMFDWGKCHSRTSFSRLNSNTHLILGQWDTFFSRFSGSDQTSVAALQLHQQRLREGAAAAAGQQAAGQFQYPATGPTGTS